MRHHACKQAFESSHGSPSLQIAAVRACRGTRPCRTRRLWRLRIERRRAGTVRFVERTRIVPYGRSAVRHHGSGYASPVIQLHSVDLGNAIDISERRLGLLLHADGKRLRRWNPYLLHPEPAPLGTLQLRDRTIDRHPRFVQCGHLFRHYDQCE